MRAERTDRAPSQTQRAAFLLPQWPVPPRIHPSQASARRGKPDPADVSQSPRSLYLRRPPHPPPQHPAPASTTSISCAAPALHRRLPAPEVCSRKSQAKNDAPLYETEPSASLPPRPTAGWQSQTLVRSRKAVPAGPGYLPARLHDSSPPRRPGYQNPIPCRQPAKSASHSRALPQSIYLSPRRHLSTHGAVNFPPVAARSAAAPANSPAPHPRNRSPASSTQTASA